MPEVASTTQFHVVAREPAATRVERWAFHAVLGFLFAIAIVLLIAPTIVVLITSFTASQSLKFPPTGYSLQWYAALWNDSPEVVGAAILSFKIAAIATGTSVLLAGAAALALARRRE